MKLTQKRIILPTAEFRRRVWTVRFDRLCKNQHEKRWGETDRESRIIWIDPRVSEEELIATAAHEIQGHAVLPDEEEQALALERAFMQVYRLFQKVVD